MSRVGLRHGSWVLVTTLALCATACGDDAVVSEESDVGELELGGPARGVSITDVEVNQGSGVVVATAEGLVSMDERNAFLVRDRDSLVRFQVVIDDPASWIPRTLTGILHVQVPGEPESIRVHELFVEEDTDPRNLSRHFYFGMVAADAKPGTKMWIELRETDGAMDVSSLGEGRAQVPASGDAMTVGFTEDTLEMEVVIVPVRYEYLNPPREPVFTDEDLVLFHDEMLQQNPVQAVNISFREEPLVITEQLTELGSLLVPTRQLRLADEAPPHVYYHAMVDVNGSAVSDVAGIAWLTNATQEEGDLRVAATVFHKRFIPADEEDPEDEDRLLPPSGSVRTWVHEVGHNQGFRHIKCQGADSANPDGSYPYDDGKLGGYGFGIRNYHLYTPGAAHDYMSYCGNSWVSDWTWQKAYERISLLTSWGMAAPAPELAAEIAARREPALVGMIYADGSEEWTVLPAVPMASPSGEERLEFWAGGDRLTSAPVDVVTLGDHHTRVMTVTLPALVRDGSGQGLGAAVELWREDGAGERRAVAVAREGVKP